MNHSQLRFIIQPCFDQVVGDTGQISGCHIENQYRKSINQRFPVQPCFFIGGPDGLGPACLEAASAQWSLSGLTLPHGLAKIIVVEALYRAWMVDEGHPYHRE